MEEMADEMDKWGHQCRHQAVDPKSTFLPLPSSLSDALYLVILAMIFQEGDIPGLCLKSPP
jgi:hypothetical protein